MTEQEYRASMKRHHICRNCKQTDAYTLAGRTYCAECAEKDAEKKRKLRTNEEYRQKAIQTTREWRTKNAAENRCARCGKPLPTGWKNKCCCECLTYSKKKAKERRQKAGALTWDMRRCDGICFICGEPTIGTRKMCDDCYQTRIDGMIRNLEKAHEKQEIKKQISYEQRRSGMACKAKENGKVSRRGKPSIEWYKDGKPQYYCYGYIDKMTDELLPECKECRSHVSKA